MSEFLTPLQVTSFFSRLAAKVRQQSVADVTEGMGAMEDDAASASEETNFARARNPCLESLQLVHPITCDQYDVCAMVLEKIA